MWYIGYTHMHTHLDICMFTEGYTYTGTHTGDFQVSLQDKRDC